MAPCGAPVHRWRARGVSLVVSHCLADGLGGCLAVAEAACGYDKRDQLACLPGSRRRVAGAARGRAPNRAATSPGIGRAVVGRSTIRRAQPRPWPDQPPRYLPRQRRRFARADEFITIPTATIFIDADEWGRPRTRARGNQQHAACGIGGPPRPSEWGRVTADGSVHLSDARQRPHR